MPRVRCALCSETSTSVAGKTNDYYSIPFNNDEALQRWQNGIGMQFERNLHTHVCQKHFADDQFCKSHDWFLQMTNTKGKRKLVHNGFPGLNDEREKVNDEQLKAGPSNVVPARSLQPRSEAARARVESFTESTPQKTSSATSSTSNWHMQMNVSPILPVLQPQKSYSRKRLLAEASAVSPAKASKTIQLDSTAESEDLTEADADTGKDPTWNEASENSEMDESINAPITAIEEKAEIFCNSKYVICDVEELEELLKKCHKCADEDVIIEKFSKGAMMSFEGTCKNGHKVFWRSSKYCDQKPLINTLLATACLCSGIPFAAMKRLSSCTELAFMSSKTFYDHHTKYANPVIKKTYYEMREKVAEEIRQLEGAVFSGDARFDSPGVNSAKFCHYSLLEVTTNLIVDFAIWQKGLAPGEMESKAFHFLFDRVLSKIGQEKVKIFCSDRNLSVGKVMKTFFKTVHHAFDVWHIAKGLSKKLTKASIKTPCIKIWKKGIINHVWYSAQSCGEDEVELLETWKSLRYHVQNIHQWKDSKGRTRTCKHAPLTEEQIEWTDWIDSEADLRVLDKLLFNTRLLNQLKQCKFFIHTGSLESFHNLCLVYCPKRISYTYEGMVIRTIIAIIDHNTNVGRKVTGDQLKYSKATKEYKLQNKYEDKDQSWRRKLVQDCVKFVTSDTFVEYTPDYDELLKPFDLPKTISVGEKPSLEEMREGKVRGKRM